jgi:hypothetical protein
MVGNNYILFLILLVLNIFNIAFTFLIGISAYMCIPKIVPICYQSGIKEITLTFPLRNEYFKKIYRKEFYNNSTEPNTDTLLHVLSCQTEEDVSFDLSVLYILGLFSISQ